MIAISPLETYYFHRVVREGWLGSKSPTTCRRILTEEKDVLKPEFMGQGRATRILIIGANIQRYQRKAAVLKTRK